MRNTRSTLAELLQAAMVLILAFVAIGFCGRTFWLFDLFSHFRVQYAVALFAVGFFLLLLGRRWSAVLALIFAMGLGSTFLSLPHQPPTTPAALKLVSFNVFTSNERHQDVLAFLESENADVVFLMEVDDRWLNGLQSLKKLYPHEVRSPRDDNFGVLLFSKYPFTQEAIHEFGPYQIPAIEAIVQKEGQSYRLYGIHPPPPVNGKDSKLRNQQLLEAAGRLGSESSLPVILMGDFNMTPFSPWFGEILKRGQFVNTSVGSGISPTWMRRAPLVAIALDHVLISDQLRLVKRSIGPSLGSDHNALIVEVALHP